jgi:F0F1-type ATP synthase delta subunit
MSQATSRRDIVRVFTARLLSEPDQQAHWVQCLAAFLLMNNLVDDADLIINDVAYELQVQAGLLTVEVVSARELSDSVRTALRELLKSETGAASVVLHETTDQALLGGFVARTPDAEIDASVQTKLKKLAALA